MTVREAFSKAFGPVPDGATCHVGHWAGPTMDSWRMEPTTHVSGGWPNPLNRSWDNGHAYEFPIGPDISDRPASSFLGFFGAEYDAVVNSEVKP